MDEPVLLTGAGGRVGRAIRDRLGGEYDWRLLDRRPPEDEPRHEFTVADVTDGAAVRAAMADVGAVIHLAADPRPEAPWESVLENNIDGTRTVFEAAVEAGVEKVVFASSNHAVGHYETGRQPDIYRRTDPLTLDGTELPRPSNLYGVSKAAGEVLGRYYHDEADLSVACVRIGNLTEGQPPEGYERGQAMWLSHRDCAHLFDRCLKADYEYEIVYGISDNANAFYDLDRARDVLGYEPRDDAMTYD
ncbi:MAG: NAD-dependent glucose-6-phosphate dehydrogenase Azf [Halobacteriaceae archaeon]